MQPSTGSVCDAYDNATCESFFATWECELLARRFHSSRGADGYLQETMGLPRCTLL